MTALKNISVLAGLVCMMTQVCVNAWAESNIEQGRRLYLSYGCATCHGENGDGHGIVAQKSNPPPIDFRDQRAYRHGSSRTKIAWNIKYGIKEGQSVMPAFDHLTADELEPIAAYLESLQKKLPHPRGEEGSKTSKIIVNNAWVRLMPPSRPNSAAYMTIENKNQQEIVLQSVSSNAVTTVELHIMEHSDGMMKMRQISEIRIPAGGKTELKPGGSHLMLFGIQKPLAKGDIIPFVFHFQDGSSVAVEATAKEDEQ